MADENRYPPNHPLYQGPTSGPTSGPTYPAGSDLVPDYASEGYTDPGYNIGLTDAQIARWANIDTATLAAIAISRGASEGLTREQYILFLHEEESRWVAWVEASGTQRFPQATREQRLSALAEQYQRYWRERWGLQLGQEEAMQYATESIEGGETSSQEIYERLDNMGRNYWGPFVGPGEDWRAAVSPYMAAYEQWTGLEAHAETEAIQWLAGHEDGEERNIATFRKYVMSQPDYWETPGGKELERREAMSMAEMFGV